MQPEQTLEYLQRQVRQLRALAIFNAAAALCAVFAAFLLRGNGGEVRAHKFSLIDRSGRTHLELSEFQKDRYGLTLFDSAGRARMALKIEPDGSPRVSLAAESGQALADLLVFREAPRLTLANAAGVEFLSFIPASEGAASIALPVLELRPLTPLAAR